MGENHDLLINEQALEALSEWSQSLKSFQQRLGVHFARTEARQAAFDYVKALLSPVERKNGWQMAEFSGYPNPYRVQHLLGRARWDAEAVRAEAQRYIHEHLAEEQTILAVDETGFLKQGNNSVGVQVQ